jgi:hypothetical protein
MQQQQDERRALQESRIQLALEAIKRDATLSQRRAAKIYNVLQTTLGKQHGSTFWCNCVPNSIKLLKTEEEVIVQHILDFDVQGFPPRLAAVKDMADLLLAERHQDPVGQNCAANFVKHRPELKVKFNQKYNYRRALCEDPNIIRGWFQLVENTKAKYGIQDKDTYSFDKSGFMMGMILTRAVVTGAEHQGWPKSI